MILTKRVRKTEHQIQGFICSACKTEYHASDVIEMQEGIRWSDTGGYGSVFGDGQRVRLDLCQHCVLKLLGDYIEYGENNA